MSAVRNVDGGIGDPEPIPKKRVRKRAQVQNGGGGTNWPFLYTYKEGEVYTNKAKRTRRIDEANRVGEALL